MVRVFNRVGFLVSIETRKKSQLNENQNANKLEETSSFYPKNLDEVSLMMMIKNQKKKYQSRLYDLIINKDIFTNIKYFILRKNISKL